MVTRRGVVLLALVAVTAIVLPGALVVALFVMALAAVAADIWQVRTVPSITVDMPTILSRGRPATLASHVDRAGVRTRLTSVPDLRVAQPVGGSDIETTVTALRRGTHTLPAPSAISTGPLALGRRRHRPNTSVSTTVYPDMVAARHIANEVRLGRFGDSSRRSRGPLGLGTELETIREYLPDDDIRQVNWKATARVGTPMSNTYRIEQERDVMILVDCGRLMAAPVDDPATSTRLDVAVDTAAAVAAVADVVGDRVGVVAFDRTVLRRLAPRRDGGRVVARAVHDLEPSDSDSNYSQAFHIVAGSKRAFILILTDLFEETAALPLINAMPLLARHHSVTVASVRDPAIAGALATPAETVGEAYTTAVAVDVDRSQRLAASRISGVGATVIDASPDHLPTACVSAYLRAKRHARI